MAMVAINDHWKYLEGQEECQPKTLEDYGKVYVIRHDELMKVHDYDEISR